MIVVIPSNRRVDLRYLAPLIDGGARFIVVDDSEGSIHIDHPAFSVYDWADRRRVLGALDHHFPRANGACRSFGFGLAWRESDPGEAIVALDDDCRVLRADFCAQVERALSDQPRPLARVAGQHFNILDLYRGIEQPLFPRGFPYSARGDYRPAAIGEPIARRISFSLGLWTNVFDVNAVDKIAGPPYVYPDAELLHPSVLVPDGALISVCSMNMQLRREILPAAYQLPMNVEVIPGGGVIDRYGDIWGGFVLKTLMDLRGDAMAVGEPLVEHLKDGDYRRNLWQENLCHQLNDEFLDVLAQARDAIKPAAYLDMMAAFREVVLLRSERSSPLLRCYFAQLAPALEAWLEFLR